MGINISSNYIPAININIGMSVSGTLSVSANSFYNVTNYQTLNITKPEGPEDLLETRLNTPSQITSYSNDNLTYIAPYTFSGTGITFASFPNCQTISNYAFNMCSSLTSVSFLACTSIGPYAFASCSALTTASFPSCQTISNYTFTRCSLLTLVSFPVCTTIGNGAFANCSSLTTANFPNCTSIGTSAFFSCSSLTTASFPACTNIFNFAFAGCYNLLSLYLLGSSVCSLTSTWAFTSTPISNYTTSTGGVYGKIYVPTSLYNSYITATNWVNFSSRFVSV